MITTLYLMPTQKCNCECGYCYVPAAEKHKQGDADFFHSVVEKFIHDLGVNEPVFPTPQLRFVGGEPYLVPDLLHDLSIKFLDAFPQGMVVINTNGTLVSAAGLARLEGRRSRIFHIVSLDGPEQIHNHRRKLNNSGNAWLEALLGIETLLNCGFPVYLNTVLDGQSVTGLGDLMRFISRDFGMDSLSVSLLQRLALPLANEEKQALLAAAYQLAGQHRIRLGGHHRLMLGPLLPGLRCAAGRKTILVTSDGQLVSCQRFVGRTPRPGRFRPDLDLTRAVSEDLIDDCCYSPEALSLGQWLYGIYQERYPEYLEVSQLDRILFGVIP